MNLRQPSFWNELKDGIAGKSRDYTSGSLGRAVLLLAVPMVLEMVMQSVFAVVDMYFIGRLGRDAVAAAGMTDSMLTLVFSIAMGLSMAAAAMVARRIGEKDPEQASLAAVQAIALGVFLSVPIAIAGVVLAPDFLRWMGATPGIIETGQGFTAIMLGTNVTVMLLFLINAIFRGGGDAMIAMRALARELDQYHPRPDLHLRLGAHPRHGDRRGGHCHGHRTRLGRVVSAPSARAWTRPRAR